MTPARGEATSSPNFKAVLYGLALTALARASLVLAVCIIMDASGGQSLGLNLRTAVLAFGLLGGAGLGRGLRAERTLEFEQASRLYALALVNFSICYAALLAGSLLSAGESQGT
ncbi:hypothetical protein [Microvirga sp. Mcv34]|uniref:hypothetical protein n=1 Tax=Microvirga sp. Mcv34 TaxID=2926016 RepID=UPI0021CACDD9|nr:hypothetical protein [Microvirga sp. Mcv34]